MSLSLLQVKQLDKNFGGVKALQNIDMNVEAGEIVGLIGPNGAGKSTFFASISGYFKPDRGTVIFDGENINGLRPDQIAMKGMVRTFQIVQPIKEMTVKENITVGALMRYPNLRKARKKADEVLDFIGLSKKANQEINELTLANKKRLEIGRALACEPKLILLDEVMAGLTPSETLESVDLIHRINSELDITLIIVEHVMEVIMPLSHRVVVLEYGAKIAEGEPQLVANNLKVIDAYLGSSKYQKGGIKQ